MRELELLQAAEVALDEVCGCNRTTCAMCRLRLEISAYVQRANEPVEADR